jgi:hypothetical protein
MTGGDRLPIRDKGDTDDVPTENHLPATLILPGPHEHGSPGRMTGQRIWGPGSVETRFRGREGTTRSAIQTGDTYHYN